MTFGIHPVFFNRDFSAAPQANVLQYAVKQYEWHYIGGPKTASIEILNGDFISTQTALDFIRCPVILFTEIGYPVWWGFVSSVELYDGPYLIGLEIDNLRNRVAFRYVYKADGGGASTSLITTFAQDAESIAKYGAIEFIGRSNSGTTSSAEADRDLYLANHRYPNSLSGFSKSGARPVIKLKGWWDTFGWLYYQNTGEDHASVKEQFSAIYADVNQFCDGLLFEADSSFLSNEYRDGSRLGVDEMTSLIGSGSDNGKLLTAYVDQYMYLRVEETPDQDEYIIYERDRSLSSNTRVHLESYTCPVGVWMNPEQGFDIGALSGAESPYPVFVESATYNIETGEYTPRTIGKPSPFDAMSGAYR